MTEGNKRRMRLGAAILLVAITVLCLFTLASCSKPTVAELSIKDAPQVVVIGQFQISQVILTAKDADGNETDIPASNSMLTTEGRTALKTPGPQNVGIYYGQQSVTWSVLVVDENTQVFTVSFKQKSGDLIATRTVVAGTSVESSVPSVPDTDEQGLKFAGWVNADNTPADLKNITSDCTFYAEYTENVTMYTVTFVDYKNTEVSKISVRHGSLIQAPAYSQPAEIESYSWNWDFSKPVTSSVTITMSYKLAQRSVQYAYAFESNLNVTYPLDAHETVTIGSAPSAATRQAAEAEIRNLGLTLVEWTNNVNAVRSDVTIVAKVQDRTFTVTYEEASSVLPEEVLSGAHITLPTTGANVRYGYTFNGQWEDVATGTQYSGDYIVRNNVTFRPVYNRNTATINIFFDFEDYIDNTTGNNLRYSVSEDAMFGDTIDRAHIEEVFQQYLAQLQAREDAVYDDIKDFGIQSIIYTGKTTEVQTNADYDLTAGSIAVGPDVQTVEVSLVDANVITKGLKTEKVEADGAKHLKVVRDDSLDAEAELANKIIYIPATATVDGDEIAITELADELFKDLAVSGINFAGTEQFTFGNNVFNGATLGSDINLPNIGKMGTGVFQNAKTPDGVEIAVVFGTDSAVKELDGDLFRASTGITKVVLPASVEKIGDSSRDFNDKDYNTPGHEDADDKDEIAVINLDNVKEIGKNVFAHSRLVDIGSFASLRKIGEHAFCGTLLESVVLETVEQIGTNAFGMMPNMATFELTPASDLETFEFSFEALKGSNALKTVTLNEGVTKVYYPMPAGITYSGLDNLILVGLNTINLPTTLQSIGEYNFFADLPYLTAINVAPGNAKFVSDQGVLFDIQAVDGFATMVAFAAGISGNYMMPEKVADKPIRFATNLDWGVVGLNTLEIPASVLKNALAEADFDLTWKGGRVENLLVDGDMFIGESMEADLTKFFEKLLSDDNKISYVFFRFADGEEGENAVNFFKTINEKFATYADKCDVYLGGTQLSKFNSEYNLIYKIDGENAIIRFGDNTAAEIIIPEKLDGYTVVSIDEGAFLDYENLVRLTVEAKLDGLKHNVFSGCVNLEFISIAGWADGVTSDDLDSSALKGTKYAEITHIMALGGLLFKHKDDGHHAHVPGDALEVTADMMPGVKEIPAKFFEDEYYLKSIEFPDTLTTIGEEAFKNSSVEIVDFNKVTTIGRKAFENCVMLKSAVMNNVANMGALAFAGCTSLEEVDLGSRLSSGYLPQAAFYNCSSLKKVSIPLILGAYVGSTIAYDAGTPQYDENGNLSGFDGVSEEPLNGAFTFAKSGVEDISFVSNFTRIPQSMFAECNNITKIDFTGTSVATIETNAFINCANVVEIVIPNSVTEIKEGAFVGSNALKSVKFVGTGGIFNTPDQATFGKVFGQPLQGGQYQFNFYLPATYQSATDPKGLLALLSDIETLGNGDIPVKYSYPTINFALYQKDNQKDKIDITGFGLPSITSEVYLWEAPEAPQFDGYIFDDWYYQPIGGSDDYLKITEYPFYVINFAQNDSITLYARYISVNRGTLDDNDVLFDEEKGYYVLQGFAPRETVNIPAMFDGPNGLLPIKEIKLSAFTDQAGEDERLHSAHPEEAVSTVYTDALRTLTIPEGVEILSDADKLPLFNKINDKYYVVVEKLIIPASVTTILGNFPLGLEGAQSLEIEFVGESNLINADRETFKNTKFYFEQYERAEANAKEYGQNTMIMAGRLLIEAVSAISDGKKTFAMNVDEMKKNIQDAINDEITRLGESDAKVERKYNIGYPSLKNYNPDGADAYFTDHGYTYVDTVFYLPENTLKIGKGVFAKGAYYSKEGGVLVEPPTSNANARTTRRITAIYINRGLKYIHVEEASDPSKTIQARFDCAFAYSSLSEVYYLDGDNLTLDIWQADARAFRNTPWLNSQMSTFVVLGTVLLRYNDHGAATIQIPDYITEIARGAFGDASSVQHVTFSENSQLKKISDGAFRQAKALVDITLPAITEMGTDVFADCPALQKVDMSKALITELPAGTFGNYPMADGTAGSGCTSLDTLILPDCMTSLAVGSINKSASKATTEGRTIVNNITARGLVGDENLYKELCDTGFYKNATDEFVVLGKVLVKYNTPAEPNYSGDDEGIASEEGLYVADIPSGVEYILDCAFNNSGVNVVNMPATVKTIGSEAFGNTNSIQAAKKLTDVSFAGSGLVEIGNSAFANCSALSTIVFPDSLVKIGELAFNETALTNVELPDSVTELSARAFESIEALEQVVLSPNLTSIGAQAFYNDVNLYRIDWSITEEVFGVLINNIYHTNFEALGKEEAEARYAKFVKDLFGFDVKHTNAVRKRMYLTGMPTAILGEVSGREEGQDKLYTAWKDPIYSTDDNENYKDDTKIYLVYDGVELPKVSLELGNETTLDILSAETLTSLPSPAGSNDQVFVGWYNGDELVDPSEEEPYKVYDDITLTAKWFNVVFEVNIADSNLTTATINGLTFEFDTANLTATLKGVDLEAVKSSESNVLVDTTLYLPARLRITRSGIGSGTYICKVSGIDAGFTVTGEDKASGLTFDKLVLTEASYFNGMTENEFAVIGDRLREVEFLTAGNEVDMISEDGVIYSADGMTLIAYFAHNSGEEVVKSYEIRDGVVTILPKAFANSGLTELKIPNTVTTIGKGAFNDELATIEFAEGIRLTDASKYSFNNTAWFGRSNAYANGTVGYFYAAGNMLLAYEKLGDSRSLSIPDTLGGHAITVFAEDLNFNLTAEDSDGDLYEFPNMKLPVGLEKINANAFRRVNILQNVDATGCDNLNDIAPNAFDEMDYYQNANSGMVILGNVLLKCTTTERNITVPNGITAIAANAFASGQVQTLSLPNTLRYIGENAFYSCTSLTTVNIPDSVVEIGNNAFAICTSLSTVSFNMSTSNLERIGNNAFESDGRLVNINLPYRLKSIGDEAFIGCSRLTLVTFDYFEDVRNDEDGTVSRVIREKSELTELGARAFQSCLALTSISIPNGVVELKEMTFANCTGLVNVEFDISNSKLRYIRTEAFSGCERLGSEVDLTNYDPLRPETSSEVSLITLALPNSLSTIEDKAFSGCIGLLGVRLQYNVTDMGNDVFMNATNLAKVEIYSATPAAITATTFISGDERDERRYTLRIYVNDSVGNKTLDRYRVAWTAAGWTDARQYLYSRKEVPVVTFGLGSNTTTVSSDIFVDPLYNENARWTYNSIIRYRFNTEIEDVNAQLAEIEGKTITQLVAESYPNIHEQAEPDSKLNQPFTSNPANRENVGEGIFQNGHGILIIDFDKGTMAQRLG